MLITYKLALAYAPVILILCKIAYHLVQYKFPLN